MKLTEHFTLEELTATSKKIKNIPTEKEISALKKLCENVLEPLRVMYGGAIVVNSGFRSPELNSAIGGSKTSQHVKGEAADLDCNNNRLLFELIKNNFEFDQLINEKNYSWIHVSFSDKNRNQCLDYVNGKYIQHK